jgi:hypothetical protein
MPVADAEVGMQGKLGAEPDRGRISGVVVLIGGVGVPHGIDARKLWPRGGSDAAPPCSGGGASVTTYALRYILFSISLRQVNTIAQ